jgi:glycosyltransferase involved in cell wall biosynthesis
LKDEFGASDTVLVPNGVDRIQFESAARAKAPAPTVGFMNSGKRFKASHVAIEALRLVQRAEPDLRIVSFGSSPLPRHHGLAHVTYALRPRKERIADIYRSADCWIISSESEGFGMPGLEAAACRCPVVSTRCGGPEDYVLDGKSGHLVEVGDPQGLAERVLDVLRLEPDAWRRMSEASYGMARRFDWDRSAEMLEKALIERLT